jgi:hypothetical protein
MTGNPMPPLAAIRAKCLDCCGDQPSEVRLCTIVRCALHPFRMGSNPHRKRRELSDNARAALVSRLGVGRKVSPEIRGKTRANQGPMA